MDRMREKTVIDRMLKDYEGNKSKSRKWWSELSINEMKALTKKYFPEPHMNYSFVNIVPSLVFSIYEQEQGGVNL